MGFTNQASFTKMRNKDGIYIYRVKDNGTSYVLKYFMKDEYTREIDNYLLLQQLEIPTIKVIAHTDKALLLEDLQQNDNYRLGTAVDLTDLSVAKALAKWYQMLHRQGAQHMLEQRDNFYSEIEVVTQKNIEVIKTKTNTAQNPS